MNGIVILIGSSEFIFRQLSCPDKNDKLIKATIPNNCGNHHNKSGRVGILKEIKVIKYGNIVTGML